MFPPRMLNGAASECCESNKLDRTSILISLLLRNGWPLRLGATLLCKSRLGEPSVMSTQKDHVTPREQLPSIERAGPRFRLTPQPGFRLNSTNASISRLGSFISFSFQGPR